MYSQPNEYKYPSPRVCEDKDGLPKSEIHKR
jgi:hypothetical protein